MSWPAYRFLKRQVRWSGIPISFRISQFIVIHRVKGFGIVNKAEIDILLELSCFFDDPVDIGNLICGSSAFSKTSLNIWNFMVHVLLKPWGLNMCQALSYVLWFPRWIKHSPCSQRYYGFSEKIVMMPCGKNSALRKKWLIQQQQGEVWKALWLWSWILKESWLKC